MYLQKYEQNISFVFLFCFALNPALNWIASLIIRWRFCGFAVPELCSVDKSHPTRHAAAYLPVLHTREQWGNPWTDPKGLLHDSPNYFGLNDKLCPTLVIKHSWNDTDDAVLSIFNVNVKFIFFYTWIAHMGDFDFFCIVNLRLLCAGVDGAAVSGPPTVCGSSQLSMDGCLALSHDASFPHSNRPEHAAGSKGPLQGCILYLYTHKNFYFQRIFCFRSRKEQFYSDRN